MDWGVKAPDQANHAPQVVLNGEQGTHVVDLKAKPSESFRLSSARISDPDGNPFRQTWNGYDEASDQTAAIKMGSVDSHGIAFAIPPTSIGRAHVVFAVTDAGDPPLTCYRRAVVEISP